MNKKAEGRILNVEQGMLNVEVFLHFKIRNSTLNIQDSIALPRRLVRRSLDGDGSS
jgi:hypothetical protein